MPSEIVQRVLDQIHLLTAEEREEVKALMDSVPFLPEPRDERDRRDQHLMRQGVITRAPRRAIDTEEFNKWVPIEVTGKPVSETLIEERR